MASISYAKHEISVKIVYYGPGMSGKTANLQAIYKNVLPESRSELISLSTEGERTLFFDFLPLDLGKINGLNIKLQLYTVPGQVYYNATRKLVLRGADGIVFVADSAPDKIDENLESLNNLDENLLLYKCKREELPMIMQYNKRDLPNALSIDEMHQRINHYKLPWTEAVANKGIGVFDSLKLICKIVIDDLSKKYLQNGPRLRGSSGAAQPQRNQPSQPVQGSPRPQPT